MAQVRSTDTSPEIFVRRLLHSMGYQYRLHVKSLPGNPDIVFPRKHKAIFVHGCFWHQHNCKRGRRRPTSNKAYWHAKLDKNKQRDKRNRAELRKLGWKCLVVWECQIQRHGSQWIQERIQTFLNDS